MQGACVQNVLDSLIPALLADKNRKFIYVEQARVLKTIYIYIYIYIPSLYSSDTTLTHVVASNISFYY
jgi:uncharacterized membrane protein